MNYFENKFAYHCNTLYLCSVIIKNKDMKTETILIRVEPELKNKLQMLANMDKRKLSDYARLQLMKVVETSKKKK